MDRNKLFGADFFKLLPSMGEGARGVPVAAVLQAVARQVETGEVQSFTLRWDGGPTMQMDLIVASKPADAIHFKFELGEKKE